jgi:hypothetical protein
MIYPTHLLCWLEPRSLWVAIKVRLFVQKTVCMVYMFVWLFASASPSLKAGRVSLLHTPRQDLILG